MNFSIIIDIRAVAQTSADRRYEKFHAAPVLYT